MTGADAMVKCLEAQGIDVVFGYPGVAIARSVLPHPDRELPI